MALTSCYSDDLVTLHRGDCLDVLPSLPDASMDAVVTDPPYGLADLKPKIVIKALTEWLTGDRSFVPNGRGFMSKDWDKFVPPPAAWDECFRVMKPGAYLLAFAAPRTADLMGISIRLAGFEVHDSLHWITGQGFPKAKSRLKPAHEPIVMARKPAKANPPLPGLDGCKVEGPAGNGHWIRNGEMGTRGIYGQGGQVGEDFGSENPAGGRWPPNILLTHSAECNGECAPDCPVGELDRQSGVLTSGSGIKGKRSQVACYGTPTQDLVTDWVGDTGGASRFFPCFRYQAKAPKSERPRLPDGTTWPTVKPLNLMRWLVRLVTPPGGTVLDCFAGTGATGQACALEGFQCVLIERDPVAARLTLERLSKPAQQQMMLDMPA